MSQNEVKFDYQKGDSGSAGILGEKCVIIEAPNLVSKNDQKLTQHQKLIKNRQKSTKQKNRKKRKTQKVKKSTKSENQKSSKTEKIKVKK